MTTATARVIEVDYCRYCSGQYDTCKTDGTLRTHGPTNDRCRGSRQLGTNGYADEQDLIARLAPPAAQPKKARFVVVGERLVLPTGTWTVRHISPFEHGSLLFRVDSRSTAIVMSPNVLVDVLPAVS